MGIGDIIHARRKISTHAPRTGSDSPAVEADAQAADFNPRSPHGERQRLVTINGFQLVFQPTLPARGATSPVWLVTGWRYFNPRSPHGERPPPQAAHSRVSAFQPTLPARGATYSRSIATTLYQFQPTLPARGATMLSNRSTLPMTISTHAPRTGSDAADVAVSRYAIAFQPTLPARGATRIKFRFDLPHIDFNPRSPHGERRQLGCKGL